MNLLQFLDKHVKESKYLGYIRYVNYFLYTVTRLFCEIILLIFLAT